MQTKLAQRAIRPGFAALLAGAMVLVLAACEKEPQTAGNGQSGDVREIVFGMQCDRTGPTQNIGIIACEAMHHYIRLFNKKQSLGEGTRIKLMEVDQGYNVPRSLEAYERFKAAGAVIMFIYGTPQTYAAAPKLAQDRIPGSSPGFGNAMSADGRKFPYLFPFAASYWSQMGSVVKFIETRWEGPKPPKIAYLHYDNPSGREPLPVLRELQEKIGFELREYAVPLPGLEMRPQVLDIVRNYKADWVITHLFGRAPSVSLKELARLNVPRDRVIGRPFESVERTWRHPVGSEDHVETRRRKRAERIATVEALPPDSTLVEPTAKRPVAHEVRLKRQNDRGPLQPGEMFSRRIARRANGRADRAVPGRRHDRDVTYFERRGRSHRARNDRAGSGMRYACDW